MIKSYKELSSEEQVEAICKVSDFMHNTLGELKAVTEAYTPDVLAKFELGLQLLELFPNCRSFVKDARMISSGYKQYINRMEYLFNIVKNELAEEMQVKTAFGEQVIVLAQAQSLRRGRPTAAESEQREKEKREQARAEALSSLTGARVANVDVAPIAERESDTSRRKKEEPNLFDMAVADETQSDEQPNELKSLREWAWCLPDPLPQQIRELRDMRAQIAAESEAAKRMLEQGMPEDKISEHTKRAKELNFQVRDIYAKVDELLACYWFILAHINKEYGKLAERYEKHGGFTVLLTDLKPYADKFQEGAMDAIVKKATKLNEAYIAATTKDPEKEKLFHKIDAYFRRKDVKASEARLKKMQEYFEQAKELGADEDTLAGFQVFIDNCKSQLS